MSFRTNLRQLFQTVLKVDLPNLVSHLLHIELFFLIWLEGLDVCFHLSILNHRRRTERTFFLREARTWLWNDVIVRHCIDRRLSFYAWRCVIVLDEFAHCLLLLRMMMLNETQINQSRNISGHRSQCLRGLWSFTVLDTWAYYIDLILQIKDIIWWNGLVAARNLIGHLRISLFVIVVCCGFLWFLILFSYWRVAVWTGVWDWISFHFSCWNLCNLFSFHLLNMNKRFLFCVSSRILGLVCDDILLFIFCDAYLVLIGEYDLGTGNVLQVIVTPASFLSSTRHRQMPPSIFHFAQFINIYAFPTVFITPVWAAILAILAWFIWPRIITWSFYMLASHLWFWSDL